MHEFLASGGPFLIYVIYCKMEEWYDAETYEHALQAQGTAFGAASSSDPQDSPYPVSATRPMVQAVLLSLELLLKPALEAVVEMLKMLRAQVISLGRVDPALCPKIGFVLAAAVLHQFLHW